MSASLILSLFAFVLIRYWALLVGIALPLPCGVFAPCLAIGAGVGRMVGETMRHIDPMFMEQGNVDAGGYAVLGAASMAAGVTRTISSAILVFELTGGLEHVLPILVAVVVSYVIGQWFTVSIFDSMVLSKVRTEV